MKKGGVVLSILFCFLVAPSFSQADFIGEISTKDGSLVAAESWATGSSLKWRVVEKDNIWSYTYTFQVFGKDISHVITEVSLNFSLSELLAGSTPGAELGTFGKNNGNSNIGIRGDIFGLKWDPTEDVKNFSWNIVTDRMPMWGDFYAMGGLDYAFNMSFGTDTSAAVDDGNAGGWVLVPDTKKTSVPEPTTMLLLGAGLLGMAFIGRRRLMK